MRRSPALTISKVCLSLRSMLASSTEKVRSYAKEELRGLSHVPPLRQEQYGVGPACMLNTGCTQDPDRQGYV